MKDSKTTYCLQMNYDLMSEIIKLAKAKNISAAALIRLAISEYIQRNS